MSPSPPKLNLLVVEDEALIAQELGDTLQDLGYNVLATCYSYAEAQQALAQYQPDLVLLDINLRSANPTHNGLALAQQLREQPAPPPFIFLTAYNDLDTIRQATRLRPSGYLIKPANDAALFAAIQTAIERGITQPQAPLPDPSDPTGTPDYFFVKAGLQIVKLNWNDVASLEAGKNYVTLRAPALQLVHAIRGSLAYVLDQLVPAHLRGQFLRVSRSVLLHRQHITSHDEQSVYCGSTCFENGHLADRQLSEPPSV
ncbi:response regulator [Hymenobacter sp. H14-R3]|uniref:LytR/AlgR family response regulator transcription factor n=1 Tax=Hymenobacter sp. H14-R3 TaxID=3046308 RepID=UPI0024B8BD0E|nr:response regulator [Hymenobacter sp. H14-R3]MDJ0366561.1 response regulator [Hymenobacter sp. H14-R3]